MTVVPIQSFFPLLRYLPISYIQNGYRGLNKLITFSQNSVKGFTEKASQDPEFSKGTFLRNLVDAEDEESGSRLSFEELVENTIIFLVAGSDTTAVTTLYTVWECGRKPAVRARLVEEIRAAFPDPGEMPTFEKASKLVCNIFLLVLLFLISLLMKMFLHDSPSPTSMPSFRKRSEYGDL